MALKRYKANSDTTIVNAYEPNMTTRGTGANAGRADVLETFSIYGRQSAASSELSRILIQFPISDIITDRTNSVIPDSGSMSFYLRLFNAQTSKTVPVDFKLIVSAISQSWQEGIGLDLEQYRDVTRGNTGANWMNASNTNVAEITKVEFTANNPANYGAASGENYIIIYDGSNRYNLWFYNSSDDSAPVADGTETKVDISSLGTIATIASQFSSVVGALDGFSTSIDSDDTGIMYVTSSTTGPVTSSTIEGTLSFNTLTVQQTGSNETPWSSGPGGNYMTASGDVVLSQSFATGLEDLEIDISDIVENWITGAAGGKYDNYGVGVFLSSSYEAYTGSDAPQGANLGGATVSYYTKRFFARGSQYFFKRPVIEARWDDSRRDNRGDFYYSSSLAPAADNLNTIYLYNYVRGRLRDIPGIDTGTILVSLYSGSSDNSAPSGSKLTLYDGNTNITGGYVATGIYSASMGITAAATPLTTLYDVWHNGTVEYSTGTIEPQTLKGGTAVATPTHYLNITNLRDKYRHNEVARFNLFVRNKYWDPTIYTVANSTVPNSTIQSASYTVYRVLDAYNAIPYGTGTDLHTVLSYDMSGNYFDCDMNLLEPGYAYAFKFSFYDAELQSWVEQSETFKFRVENYEY